MCSGNLSRNLNKTRFKIIQNIKKKTKTNQKQQRAHIKSTNIKSESHNNNASRIRGQLTKKTTCQTKFIYVEIANEKTTTTTTILSLCVVKFVCVCLCVRACLGFLHSTQGWKVQFFSATFIPFNVIRL